jgi:hypothetical protein
MGRRLRKSIVRRCGRKVDDALTTLKRHCKSVYELEGAGFVRTCEDAAGAFTFVWEAGILILWAVLKEWELLLQKGAESSDLQGHMRVYFITLTDASLACERSVRHRGKSSPRLTPGTLFA